MHQRSLIVLALLSGCSAGISGEQPEIRVGGAEEAEIIYPAFEPEDVDSEVSEDMATQVDVSWSAPEGTVSYVEFGYDLSYGTIAPASGEEDATAALLGLKADAEVHARILTVIDGEIFASADMVTYTGPLPDDIPTVSVDVQASEEMTSNFALLSVFNEAENYSALLVVDRDGDPVWWDLVPGIASHTGHRTEDGLGIVYRTDDSLHPEHAQVTKLTFDRSVREVIPSPGGHHDVVEIPGGVAVIEEDVREWQGVDVVGDQIVELDSNGGRRVVWSSWDWRSPDIQGDSGWNPNGIDWTHANGIDYDPYSNTYLLSMYSLATVIRVDRASGDVIWELGGTDSDFSFPGDSGFAPQHAPVFAPDGLWLFDNHTRSSDDPEGSSRVVRYALDNDTREAKAAWEWEDPSGTLRTAVLGDVRPLADGNLLASFGIVPRASVVSPAGEVLWQIQFDDDFMLGRGDMFRSFYGQVDITLP